MTAADVRAAFSRARDAAKRAGLDTTRWGLVEGSTTYGRAYRIHDVDPATGGQATPRGLVDNNLGMTRRDAVRTLDGMRAAWLAVSHR